MDENNYNIANFIYNEETNPKTEYSAIKAYIISNDDFDKGKNYLERMKNSSSTSEESLTIFSFYSSLEEIEEKAKNNNNFCIVKEEFLKEINIIPLYQKNVFFFSNQEKQFIFFPNDCKILEIPKKDIIPNKCFDNRLSFIGKPLKNEERESLENSEGSFEEKKKILKNLILLYINEKQILNLLKSPIKDEMKMESSYLINNNFIDIFKKKADYGNICQIIDSNLKFNNNFNLENIENIVNNNCFSNIIKNIKVLTEDEKTRMLEDNFYPDYNQYNMNYLKDGNKLVCPMEFILISKNLFDLFLKDIKKTNNKKEFKFNTLIGDNVLFIQDNHVDNVFYAFTLKDNNNTFDLTYLFKYDTKNIFYEEIKNYVKNKGFANYIIERKLKHKNISKDLDLFDQNELKIGKYSCYKDISDKEYKIMKAKNDIRLGEILLIAYKNFMNNNFSKLIDKRIDIISIINDILDKKGNLNISRAMIVLKEDFDKLKNILLFKESEVLLSSKNKKELYNTIISQLISKKDLPDVKEFVKNIKIFNPDINDKDIQSNKYNFISKEFLKLINNTKEFENKINNYEECFFFINNNEKYIFYPNQQKLYILQFVDNECIGFILKEIELNLGINEIKKYLLSLYSSENLVNNKIKSNFRNISKPEIFYLVNNNWMKLFKSFYQYDKIIKNEKINLFNNQKFPEELKNVNNLYCELNKKELNNCGIPLNFELVDKKVFDQILEFINEKNKTKLSLNYYFNVNLGDQKIFVQDKTYQTLFYIYKLYNKAFELEYIIYLEKYGNINNFISISKNHQNLEEFISFYNIDLSKKEIQNMIDENLNKLGTFKIIKSQNNFYKIKDPNHCLGLENIGATCYMNATIQCLCHVFNVKKYFQNKELVYNDTYKKNCELTLEFYKLVNNLWKEPIQNKEYYTPTDFKNCISKMNPLFQGIAANDSKDLIIFIYENIHNEINKPKKYDSKTNNNELNLFRNNYYSENSSFLIDTFYFEQESSLRCLNCQFNKISYNITNIIIFPLEKVRESMEKINNYKGFERVTLENCFDNYQEEEILSGANQIYCNSCRQMADAYTGNKMFTCPQVMTIILNRGKGLEFDVNFEYPLVLNIEKYVVDKKYGENYDYELICVLTHLGPSGMAGHFIAFCKSPIDNNWYCYNDAQVSKCIDPRSKSNNQIESIPYVLFYQKIKQKNDENTIILYFNYKEKELFLNSDKNSKFKDLINILHNNFNLPPNISFYLAKNEKYINIDLDKTINDYNLENETHITVLE